MKNYISSNIRPTQCALFSAGLSLFVLTTGCSSGGSSVVLPHPHATAQPAMTMLQIGIPTTKSLATSHRRRALSVAVNTAGIAATVYTSPKASHPTPVITVNSDISGTSSLCTASGSSRICSVPVAVPAGTYDYIVQTYDAAPISNSFSTAKQLGYAIAASQPTMAGNANTVGLSVGGVVASTAVSLPESIIYPANNFTQQITVAALDVDKNIIIPDSTGYYDASGNVVTIALSTSGTNTVLSFSPSTITTPSANGVAMTYTATNLTSTQASTTFSGTIKATPSNSGATAGTATVSFLLANATLSSFATNAGFVNSHGLAIDSSNNIYTGSTTTIYKITPAGTISTFKSGFICAWGLAFDTSGNLYVADEGANAVYKITSNSTQTTFSTSSLLNGPAGLVFDLNGNLYVSNWGGFAGTTIIKLNSTGTTATTYSTGNIGPQDMIFQANGSMLVAENGASGGASGYIGLVPTGGGSPTSVLATGTGTQGIANDANGNLWVTGWLGQQLMKYSPTFSLLETLSTTTYGTTLINDPESIRTDSIGNLYFVNWGSTTLTKIVP